MPKESSESDLFELKNFFILGNYQGAVNEGTALSSVEESDRVERDVYIYRSYIAQGKYKLVLEEIKDPRAPTALQAVKLLASYLGNEDTKELSLATLKEWMSDGVAANNPFLQIVAATIYIYEEKFEDAMRCVYQANSLEGLSLLVQIFLKINRLDLAEKELKGMQKIDDDSTITQLTQIWVQIAVGGEPVNDALNTLQDLSNKFGTSGYLLNLMGVCNVHLKKFGDAEKQFLQALEKNSSDVDTLVNLIACHQHQGKPAETITREINQLKALAPKCSFVRSLQKSDQDFDTYARQFSL